MILRGLLLIAAGTAIITFRRHFPQNNRVIPQWAPRASPFEQKLLAGIGGIFVLAGLHAIGSILFHWPQEWLGP